MPKPPQSMIAGVLVQLVYHATLIVGRGQLCQHTAIGMDGCPQHKSGVVAGQPGDDFGDVVGLAHAANRLRFGPACQAGFDTGTVSDVAPQHGGVDGAGYDTIGANPLAPIVHSHLARE